MQRNYIGPNLMNQVTVPLALLTSLACDPLSLHGGQTQAFTLCAVQSHSSREKKEILNMHLLIKPIKTVLICNEQSLVCFEWL